MVSRKTEKVTKVTGELKELSAKQSKQSTQATQSNQLPTRKNPADMLLALLAKGLHEHAKASTASQLGNRSQYIGMSDISMMQECQRLAVLRKVQPTNDKDVTLDNYEQILKRQLTLQRGHWLEDGIANALYANGFQLIPQLEISITHEQIPIKAHLDFVLIGISAIRILELKSNAKPPKTPNKSYEMQVHGQTSLLHKYWSEPVFNLKDEHGVLLYEGKTFPEICKAYLGMNIANAPDEMNIQGWLLCVSMSEAKAFGPYIPSSAIANICMQSAKTQWQHMQNFNDAPGPNGTSKAIPHAKGFCMLCTFCEYVNSCPKFAVLSDEARIPEWEQTLNELARLKEIKEKALEEIATLEDQIKQTIFPSNLKGQWIEAGQHRLRVTEQAGRKTLDKNLLIAELAPVMGEKNALQLLTDCETEGAPFARIYTNIITT